jgi:hypothetical protein
MAGVNGDHEVAEGFLSLLWRRLNSLLKNSLSRCFLSGHGFKACPERTMGTYHTPLCRTHFLFLIRGV